jgi:hypothetical protein
MNETCARCGKELSWFERHGHWNSTLKKGFIQYNYKQIVECPEYKSKELCWSCVRGLFLTGTMQRTANAEEQFKEALQLDKRTLIITDHLPPRLSPKAWNKEKRLTTYTDTATRFGYSLKQITEDRDANTTMVFEKTATTTNETNFVNCKYCKTRYNASQYFKCPQCGSPTN